MRVLVTGAGGFVGQHLVRDLLADGTEVWGATMTGRAPEEGPLSPGEAGAARWVALDVTDEGSVRAALAEAEPDRVYHLAGQSSVGASFAEPLGTWEVNATGTFLLLHLLGERTRESGPPRLLLASSAEVYGAVPPDRLPIAETAPLAPQNPYAASKAAAEMAAADAVARGRVEVVIARSFNHTGPGQTPQFALPSFALQLARMEEAPEAERVLRVGNLSAERDILDVRDVVRAYRVLMDHGESGRAYNVCSGEARALQSLVEELIELSGTSARLTVDPARVRPVDVPILLGDAGALRELGWTPRIPLRQTLADLLGSMRRGGPGRAA